MIGYIIMNLQTILYKYKDILNRDDLEDFEIAQKCLFDMVLNGEDTNSVWQAFNAFKKIQLVDSDECILLPIDNVIDLFKSKFTQENNLTVFPFIVIDYDDYIKLYSILTDKFIAIIEYGTLLSEFNKQIFDILKNKNIDDLDYLDKSSVDVNKIAKIIEKKILHARSIYSKHVGSKNILNDCANNLLNIFGEDAIKKSIELFTKVTKEYAYNFFGFNYDGPVHSIDELAKILKFNDTPGKTRSGITYKYSKNGMARAQSFMNRFMFSKNSKLEKLIKDTGTYCDCVFVYKDDPNIFIVCSNPVFLTTKSGLEKDLGIVIDY